MRTWKERYEALKDHYGYTNGDIAAITGHSPTAVKQLVTRDPFPRWLKLAIVIYETETQNRPVMNTLDPIDSDLLRPSEAQIKQTIADIQKRLKEPSMNKPVNRSVKEGYTEVITILVEDRETYAGIDKLRTLQARAIGVLGVDYLLGNCEKEVLLGVPVNE